jgi:hypothetical protein
MVTTSPDITERLDAWARHATDEETGHMELTDREWDELAADITEAANEIDRLRALLPPA